MLYITIHRIDKNPIKRIESLKNLKPTGFGFRMERINLPLVVEKPEISTNTLLLQHPWVPAGLLEI